MVSFDRDTIDVSCNCLLLSSGALYVDVVYVLAQK